MRLSFAKLILIAISSLVLAPLVAVADTFLFADREKILAQWSVSKADSEASAQRIEQLERLAFEEMQNQHDICRTNNDCSVFKQMSDEKISSYENQINDETTWASGLEARHSPRIRTAAETVRQSKSATAIFVISSGEIVAFDASLDVTDDLLNELQK